MSPDLSEPHVEGDQPLLRAMSPDDEHQVVTLLTRSLGWEADERHRELFSWKHKYNPFGSSPAWVAEDDRGIAGFRTMMRWEFTVDGSPVRAVRAVDTATDPRCRGKGIFKALTLLAIGDLQADGTAWVFNTPNSQSAPGYLSMGWQPVGRLPVGIRPAKITRLPRLLRSRQASDLWSAPDTRGENAIDLLADVNAVGHLLAGDADSAGATLRTRRTPEYLLWRFGRCPVGYKALEAPGGLRRGFVVYRVRRRGPSNEALIAEVVLDDPQDTATRRRLCKMVLESTGADYAVASGETCPPGWLPLARQGPLLTWRRLDWSGEMPPLNRWGLASGDIELF